MITKLDYRIFNCKRLVNLFLVSIIHFYLFKLPFISNYSLEEMYRNNFNNSIITITGFSTVSIELNAYFIVVVVALINELISIYQFNNKFNTVEIDVSHISYLANYFNNRLDASNPFLYSNKTLELRE